jgi:hypothetical protein
VGTAHRDRRGRNPCRTIVDAALIQEKWDNWQDKQFLVFSFFPIFGPLIYALV